MRRPSPFISTRQRLQPRTDSAEVGIGLRLPCRQEPQLGLRLVERRPASEARDQIPGRLLEPGRIGSSRKPKIHRRVYL